MISLTTNQSDFIICYSVEPGMIADLRSRVDQITHGAADLGFSTFAYVRDIQQWKTGAIDYRKAFAEVIERMESARGVILDLTTDAGAMRTGLSIEAGGALALRKPIVAIWRRPDRPAKILSFASVSGAYDRGESLRALTSNLIGQLDGAAARAPQEQREAGKDESSGFGAT